MRAKKLARRPAMPAPATPPPQPVLRAARPDDAADLARFVDMASEGFVRVVWAGMAEPGEGLMAVGTRRAARGEGGFSWRNAVIAEIGGAPAAGLVTYRTGPEPEPVDDLPPMFRPLQALENRVPDTQYVNVLATYPAFRRRGLATRLLAEAERQAAGSRGLSLIVAEGNLPARRAYAAFGFVDAGAEPIVEAGGWRSESRNWLLMLKRLG
jgi:ribosomal protein S18 acetylase RimI-like enzyme